MLIHAVSAHLKYLASLIFYGEFESELPEAMHWGFIWRYKFGKLALSLNRYYCHIKIVEKAGVPYAAAEVFGVTKAIFQSKQNPLPQLWNANGNFNVTLR